MFDKEYVIEFDHTKVGASNQTNFPTLFSGVFPQLATVGNGGFVKNANGYDIVLFTDPELTSMLPFERVSWNPVTGQSEFWTNLPSTNHLSNFPIYAGVGNSAIVTDQQNKHGTWNPNFGAAYHFSETSGLFISDSTVNNNTATATRTNILNQAGKVGNGGLFVRGASDRATMADILALHFNTAFSILYWYKDNSFSGEFLTGLSLFSNPSGALSQGTFLMHVSQDGSTPNTSRSVIGFNNAFDFTGHGNVQHTDTTSWHRAAVVWDGSDVKFYQDAVSEGSVPQALAPAYADTLVPCIGAINFAGSFFHHMDGGLDEIFVLKDYAVSQDWLTAEYNNQNDPSSFFSFSEFVPPVFPIPRTTGRTADRIQTPSSGNVID